MQTDLSDFFILYIFYNGILRKYQRNTFELQNRINSDNITFNLAGDIIGNIQTQEQTMRMLYQEVNILNELNNKLSMKEVFRSYSFDEQEVRQIKKEIEKLIKDIQKDKIVIDDNIRFVHA